MFIIVNGFLFDVVGMYMVVVNLFFVGGGDNFVIFKGIEGKCDMGKIDL